MGKRFTVISKAGEGNINTAKEEKPRFTVISKANSNSEKSILPSPTEMFKKMTLSPDPAVKQAVSAAQNGKSFASPNILAQNVYSINKQVNDAVKEVGGEKFSGLTVEETKKLLDEAKSNWEKGKKAYDEEYTLLEKGLNLIGGMSYESFEKDPYNAELEKAYYDKLNTEYILKNGVFTDNGLDYAATIKKLEKEKKEYEDKGSAKDKSALTFKKIGGTQNSLLNTDSEFVNQVEMLDKQIEYMKKDYGSGDYLSDNFKVGLKSAVYSPMAVVDATLGNFTSLFVEDKDNPFRKWNNYYQNDIEKTAIRAAKAASLTSYDDTNKLGSLTFQTAGQLVPTILGGWLFKFLGAAEGVKTGVDAVKLAADLGTTSKTAKLLLKTSTAIQSTVNNPMFYTSAMTEMGNTYNEAVGSGSDPWTASAVAMGVGLVNGYIEVAGGVEALPNKLSSNSTVNDVAEALLKTPFEELGEEILQGRVSNLAAKLTYNKEMAWSDVANPYDMAKEGLGGFIGGLMGGGFGLTVNTILNAASNSEYKKIGSEVIANKSINTQELVDYGKKSTNNEVRQIANTNNIGEIEIGKLYQYALRDMSVRFENLATIKQANEQLADIVRNEPETIINLAKREYVVKVNELTEDYNISDNAIDRYANEKIKSNVDAKTVDGGSETDYNGVETSADENTSSVFAEDDIEQGADGELNELREQTGFTEPSDREIYEPPTKQEELDALLGKPKNAKQRHIEKVSDKFGIKIIWSDEVSRGKYVPSTKSIVLNPNIRTAEMYNFVFKHEFTHYLEGKQGYTDFKNYVFKKSALFEKWVRERLDKNGIDSTGSREKIIKRLTQIQYEAYKNSDEMSKVMRDRFTMNDAEEEVLADFVGERLLGTGGQLEETLDMLSDINRKHRGIFQKIRDFVRDMINRFKGDKTFKGLVSDLEYLNERLKRVAESDNKKISDNETEKYSIAGERAVTADKSLLETAKQRIENGEESETVRRETGWFKGYDGKWRFEINDKMSELVENPKLETHGNDEDGLYQTARLADVLKHDDLFKSYPELKDYKVIIQETNTGVEGSFFPKRKEIVLSRNLFERITKEYYDYLNGGRKAEIAKIEQTPEYKEYSKFYDNPELANIDPEEWLKLEKEARNKFFSSELGKRYYQLNWGKVNIRKYEPGWSKGAKAVLFHEIQHAIQKIEGFASGSNITNWQSKINSAESEYRRAEKEYEKRYDGLVDVLARYGFSDEKFENIDLTTESGVKEAKKYLEEVGAPNGALELADALIEYANDRNNSFGKYLKLKNRSASDLYELTAGEIESRDVEKRLNYSAEQRKNTRPDIDRTDVVFADGSVSSFLSKGNKSDSKRLIQLIQENINEIPKNNLYDISGDGIIDGVKSRYILDIFDMQGNTAYRKDLGTIELTESGAESTIFHGFGKNKLIAAKGIKNVIENGKIISKIENYQNKGNTRYVIAGYGTINNLDSIMAVAINEYVAENGRKSFYLHEIMIKNKDASPFMAEQQKTVSAGKASSDITVPQKAQSVNTSISENTKNDTDKNSIAVLSADELLDKYDRGEITREEYLKQTDSMTRRAALQYVQEWERENGAILSSKNRLEAEREKAVELEREEQQMRKDRESNIWAIRRTVRKLDRALRTNTNSKHIPEAYKNVVRGFCKLFVDNDKATFEHKDLADIYSYYIEMKGNGDTIPDAPQYDPFIDELLKSLIDTLSGRKLTELNNLELNYIRMVTDALNYTVDHESQVFIDGKKAKYEEVGRAALNDIEYAKPPKLTGALKKESAEQFREFFLEGNMLPEYFLKRIGGTFEKTFKGLMNGVNKWARNMEISRKFVDDVKSKYDYDEWKDTTVNFKTESGVNVEITIDQAMQLVATAQRERSNNGQKAKHLSIGGVVIDTEAINNAMKKQGKSKEDISAARESLSNRAIQITFEDADIISKMLTDAQKGYIKEIVDFLSTQCAVWGNEVTMEQYGYRQFNESNYFPYVSSELFLAKDPAKAESTILRRASFTHSLQKNANNPLVLTSFTEIALQHIESMCNFNAMTVPLETLNKIFNYKTEADENIAARSVKAELKNAFGSGAVDYMQNLINDLNKGVRGDQRDSFLNKMTSLFKKNAVLANLSVIFQQPTAIIRACSDMKGKYFAKASKYHSKNNYEECKQYAPVAIIKQMGRFDTGIGVKNTTWLSGEQTLKEKADDFLGWGAGKADEIAWSFLWSSVKAEIADTTDLKVGSEEFLTKAGERFTELVNKTQVYDSVLTKSQNMRNKGLVGSITSFMSEPTVALNMVVNSVLDFKEGKISGKKFSRIIMSVATAEIVTAMMQSIITAARDDDEDKSYFEKYLKNVVSNSLSNFNLAGKIPYIRDVISIWEGYDVERGDIKAVSDLIKAFQTVIDENKSWDEKVRRISEALAALYGVPLKNINRDIEAIVKTIYGFAFGGEKTDVAGLEFAIGEGLGIIKNTSDKYSALAKAGENGNEEKYDRMYDNLLEAGKDEGDIKSGIKNYYRTDKDVKKEGSKLFSDLEDNKTFKSLKKEDKSQLEKDIISSLATEKTVSAMVREPDVFDELYEALRNNKNLYNQKKKELMASGMSESLIDDGIEAARISYMKSIGIDVNEYLLYKIATSKKYADTNNSGGVSKSEKTAAINKMDLDENAKRFFNGSYK